MFTIIFISHTLSWCQISGKIQEQGFYSDQTHTAFQEAFQEDLKYSDFFRDHLLQPQHIGNIRREFIFYGLETGLQKAVLNQATLTCTTELNKV